MIHSAGGVTEVHVLYVHASGAGREDDCRDCDTHGFSREPEHSRIAGLMGSRSGW
jgi:hypothetical protein